MVGHQVTLWGIHAGLTGDADVLFLGKGYIGIGWIAMGDLGLLQADRESFKAKASATYPDNMPRGNASEGGQMFRFVHEMHVGDFVAYRSKFEIGGHRYMFIGRVNGPYVYNPVPEPGYPNLRRVEWLRSLPSSQFSDGALAEFSASMSLFQITTHASEFTAPLAGVS